MLKKLHIITGFNCSKIVDHSLLLKMKIGLQGARCEYIGFPENYKHPRDHIDVLFEILNKSIFDTFVVSTFSKSIIDGLTLMIYHEAIGANSVEITILTEDDVIECKFDKDGFLQNFPENFFGVENEI